jgi:hypothetical protein
MARNVCAFYHLALSRSYNIYEVKDSQGINAEKKIEDISLGVTWFIMLCRSSPLLEYVRERWRWLINGLMADGLCYVRTLRKIPLVFLAGTS